MMDIFIEMISYPFMVRHHCGLPCFPLRFPLKNSALY